MLSPEIISEEQFITFSPEDGMGNGDGELLRVDPRTVVVDKDNQQRHTPDSLLHLQSNIEALGGKPVHPPAVRVLEDGTLEAIDGAARLKIAQLLGQPSVQVFSHGRVDDETALLMRQAANSVHKWGSIDECRGLAAGHRAGLRTRIMASKLDENLTTIINKVAIGYFPSHLLSRIEQDMASDEERAKFWSLTTLTKLVGLRQLVPGKVPQNEETLDGVYDYRLVQDAVHEIVSGNIPTPKDLDIYIEKRRNDILKERIGELAHEEAEKRTDAAVDTATKLLTQEHAREIERIQVVSEGEIAGLKSQLAEYRLANEALKKAAFRPDEEFADKNQAYQEQINRLEKAIATYQQSEANRQQLEEAYSQEVEKKANEEKDAFLKEQGELYRQSTADAIKRLDTMYAKKAEALELKTENTVRRDVAGVKGALAQVEQLMLGVISESYLKGMSRLQQEEIESFLAQLVSTQRILAEAEEKIRNVRQEETTTSEETSTEMLSA